MNIQNLKNLMHSNNIKQNQLAKELNINVCTLNNYLTQKTEPSIDTLIKFADYFNVSLDYLCNRRFLNNVGYIQDERKSTIKAIVDLDDSDFDKLSAYLSGMKDR